MKILTMASYAYFSGRKGFERNNSGFAYAVTDTCEVLSGQENDIYLLTQSAITPGFKIHNINVVRKKWIDIIFNIKLKDFKYGLCAFRGRKIKIREKLRILLYYLNRGYAEKVIKKINPDVIHIQSISDYSFPYMIAASNTGKPFIVSNHGLVSFLPNIEEKIKKRECCFFKTADKYATVVTCVSTGIKERIQSLNHLSGNNVIVIPNSYKRNNETVNILELSSLKKELGISTDAFVFISVGSISERKNQIQVARAFKVLLKKHPSKNMMLLFAGDGPDKGNVAEYVRANGLSSKVKLLGNIQHDLINRYYMISNCTVLASIDEGFGLPVIEGYSYGIPSIMFSDLDAAKDIAFKTSTVLVDQRSDDALASAMWEVVETKWDKEHIANESERFSKKVMGERYLLALKKGISSCSTIPAKEILKIFMGEK